MAFTISRRLFMKTLGSAALLSATPPALSSQRVAGSQRYERPRIALFLDEGFPAVDTAPPENDQFTRALEGCDVVRLRAAELGERLAGEMFHLLITPYGSAFPKESYAGVRSYIERGGNWINLGGRPLSVPVVRDGTVWRQEVRQVVHHKRLGITQTYRVGAEGVRSFQASEEVDGAGGLLGEFTAREFYALYVRFAEAPDFPDQGGSAGPRDARLTPLVHAIGTDGTRLAAPFVVIDRLQGRKAGGRWILATLNGTITSSGVRVLVEIALRGALLLRVQPTLACYHDDEVPRFSVQLARPAGVAHGDLDDECRLTVTDREGDSVADVTVPLSGTGIFLWGENGLKRSLRPGPYGVSAALRVRSPFAGTRYTVRHESGFWMYDEHLMASALPLSLNADFFVREGAPFPVTGTTYMSSDTHRKFLLDPNPHLWAKDFREMKASGVNMVRTGLWMGWKNYMLEPGTFNEVMLRSLDAFFLTARRFDIPVIFTFFAFIPEAWGGKNPYLDPRAVDAQKTFLAAIAQRYRMLNDVTWDLINEPSFSSPAHVWQTRPNYDVFEADQWRAWLRGQGPATPGAEEALRERWRAAADDSLGLPALQDFEERSMFDDRRPLKALDYRLFAQDMFIAWTNQMRAALRSNGNPRQLVTVGQDEGGTMDRPNPQFFAPAVEFTCNHTWWQTDDLVWDSIVTKTWDRPNLIEETGITFSEKMDGSSWRTEEELRNLLERKLAVAIGTGSAGFIQWIWNTSCYNPSDGEATVGFLRVDGTAKPELEPFRRFAAFLREHGARMVERERPRVLMIIPHSHMFSVRDHASAATKRCVRALHYHHGIGMEACSEYTLGAYRGSPALIVVPSPCVLRGEAWEWLMESAERGSTLLLSGPLDYDQYWRPVRRTAALGLEVTHAPVAQEEEIRIGETVLGASYRGDKMHRIEKAVVAAGVSCVTVPRGRGTILWSPLPLELSDSVEPTVAFYAQGLSTANIRPVVKPDSFDPSTVILAQPFRDVVLCALVSESGEDKRLRLTHLESGSTFDVSVAAQRSVLLCLDRATGGVLGRSEP